MFTFCAKGSPLIHPEAVLFINDNQTEALEFNRILYQCVGAAYDVDFSGSKALEYVFSFLLPRLSGQEGSGNSLSSRL